MDSHRKNIDWERLDRYVTGWGTPAELEAVQREIDADPELRRVVEAMRAVGRAPNAQHPTWDERTAWATMRERMRQASVRPLRALRTPGEHASPGRRWRAAFAPPWVAAAMVLAASISIVVVQHRRHVVPAAVSPPAPR